MSKRSNILHQALNWKMILIFSITFSRPKRQKSAKSVKISTKKSEPGIFAPTGHLVDADSSQERISLKMCQHRSLSGVDCLTNESSIEKKTVGSDQDRIR